MKKYTQEEFDSVVEGFIDKTLAKDKWTHQAHLAIAFWHIANFGFDDGLRLVQARIRDYNMAIGSANTKSAGYHQTLTIFWMIISYNFYSSNPDLSISDCLASFIKLNSEPSLPYRYYDKEVLFSPKARRRWVNGNRRKVKVLRRRSDSHYAFSDEAFMKHFSACTLDPAVFSHEAHLRLAWLVIKQNGIEDSTEIVGTLIRNYVKSLDAEDKFNMTLTFAATKAVNHFINRSDSESFADFILEFPRLKYKFKDLMSAHYSFDIYDSQSARIAFLEPDLLEF